MGIRELRWKMTPGWAIRWSRRRSKWNAIRSAPMVVCVNSLSVFTGELRNMEFLLQDGDEMSHLKVYLHE